MNIPVQYPVKQAPASCHNEEYLFGGNAMQLYFVCLAAGDAMDTRFGRADLYIDRLFRMLLRHVSQPFQLLCVTDKPRNVDLRITQVDCSQWTEIKTEMSSRGGKATRLKLGLFNPEYITLNEFIYLDLSLVIRANFQPLIEWMNGKDEDLLIVADWRYDGYNSCVMRIRPRKLNFVYRDFCAGIKYPAKREGDQDFITGSIHAHQASVATFPAELIQSFKDLCGAIVPLPMDPAEVMKDAVIVKFHGRPKMHDAFGGWLPRIVRVGRAKYFAWGKFMQPRWIRELNECWD